MTTTTPRPVDAGIAKAQTVKDWYDTHPGRARRVEKLTDWATIRLDDGSLLVSARVVGPDPGTALEEFGVRQEERLGHSVDPAAGDQPPTLDVSVPGRTACVWRVSGVWVEVWHPNTPTPPPGRSRPAQRVPRPVPAPPRHPAVVTPSGRLPLGERLTRMRRNLALKEN
ncbi:hypothetical protein E6R18_32910 [Streptomyces sp. A1277]|uniref:hypothetical protein n=1 Tax=Streptomyces sp. A1277 TaxID=2563103 RepID=UPI0010A22D09|nr:hypothetical protein [Streptomyces sp. A1277]THA22749.1 hypothetical protein E6R18_32910 [Streptomyces sp. A1277]